MNKEIATDLRISEASVRNDLHTIFPLLGVSTRTELAVKALRDGLVH